jgi:hypothetical protein
VKALKPLLWKSEAEEVEMCNLHDPKKSGMAEEFTLTPLDEQHVLISTPCWLAAYNASPANWVMDSALKGTPEFVTAIADGYANGIIYGVFKSRGLGDCWGGSIRVWDGREFRKSSERHTGMCRLIEPGGAWDLPTLVTQVIDENGTPREYRE